MFVSFDVIQKEKKEWEFIRNEKKAVFKIWMVRTISGQSYYKSVQKSQICPRINWLPNPHLRQESVFQDSLEMIWELLIEACWNIRKTCSEVYRRTASMPSPSQLCSDSWLLEAKRKVTRLPRDLQPLCLACGSSTFKQSLLWILAWVTAFVWFLQNRL